MEIFDLHNDILTSEKNAKQTEKYLQNHTKTNITAALWTTKLNDKQIEKQIQRAVELKEKYSNMHVSIEDFGFVNKKNYETVKTIKPKYVGLTWNDENLLAGGANSYGELTKFGKNIIEQLNTDKIILDTAHLNEKSFMQAVNYADKVICSHAAFSGVFDHKRNLKDYQIKMILERGGIIGLCFVSDFLSPSKKCTIKDVATHIEYFINKYEDNSLCIGSDFYGTKHLPKGIKDYKDLEKLAEILRKKGYSDETIAKIFYHNAATFFNEV